MPIEVAIKYTDTCHKQGISSEEQSGRSKLYWSNYYCDEIYNKYVQPLFRNLEKVSDSSPLKADQITKLITSNSSQLLCPKKKKRGKSVFVRLPVGVKTVRSFSKATLSLGSKTAFLLKEIFIVSIAKVVRRTDRCWAFFYVKFNLTESLSCVLPLILMKNYSGNVARLR